MSGRRLLAAAGVALFALLLAATPAAAAVAAAEKPTVRWTRPTVEKPVLTAPGPITATISTRPEDNQGIKSVTFELVQPVDDPEHPCFVDVPEEQRVQGFPDKPTSVDVEFDARFPCNGSYELKAFVKYDESLLGVPITERNVDATLSFDVAIPPARVTGLKAAYDPAPKQVGLTWKPNTEPDLAGYRVERNPPGPAGFETVAPLVQGTRFDDAPIDAEHRYRVFAVREGPDGRIEGRASVAVTAGPDAPQPTAPRVGPPNQRRPATSGTSAGGNRPTVRKRTVTTVDTGFSKDLPFDPSQTTTTEVPTTTSEPEGQAAVLAEFDDDDPRGTLVPIAGGLALLMSAVHMRLLSKRLGDDDIPILPGS